MPADVVPTTAVTVLSAPTEIDVSGTVTAVADDGSAFSIETADGQALTFSTGGDSGLIADYAPGDNVEVGYVQVLATRLVRDVRDTAAPATQTVSGTITSVADDGSSFTPAER